MSEIKQRILDDIKLAMKARETDKVAALRLLTAALKQEEVDSRKELTDQDVLVILDKMVKRGQDSSKQYTEAGRPELAEKEEFEIGLMQKYLPQALSSEEITQLIEEALSEKQATSMKDMGAVMALLKPKMQGRADMSQVSQLVKQRLT